MNSDIRKEFSDTIYPTMVIRSQAETIELQEQEIERLNNSIKQKDNTLKEIREYMNKHEIEEVYLDCKLYETQAYKDILEILDKESDKE